MASAPNPNVKGGHVLTRPLVLRTSAPPTSHTRQSSQSHPQEVTPDPPEQSPIDSALNASTKTGESLTALLKALGEFQGDVSGARASHEHLQAELEQIRELLGRTNAERLEFKNRVIALEAELSERGDVADLDAKYIQEEQDRFIAALIDEHESTVKRLRAERDEALAKLSGLAMPSAPHPTIPSPAPDVGYEDDLALARQRVEKLVAEREKTRALIKRAQTQRDAAQAKAERLEKELTRLKARVRKTGDDKHTRPTDPPPDSANERTSADAITVRPPKDGASERPTGAKKATRKRSHPPRKPAQRPRSRELQLSELEQEWDRTTTPAPPPSYEAALDERTRSPGSLRQPSPPAELRAALTSPSSARTGTRSAPPASSVPMVIRAAAKPAQGQPANVSPTLPKVTPPLEQAQTPASAEASSRASQPPSTMSYPADKKPPLKQKPDPTKRPLVGYSTSEVAEERIRTRPSGVTRTRS